MKQITTITWLTVKAALRYRLVLVLGVLLLGCVVALPLLIKDDGTARGFTQVLLTYTLTAITTLLGFSTLWLACGTLANEISECQLQMVLVKPVARWQVWLGKWLGIMVINAFLLALSGGAVYALLTWRVQHLPEEQREILKNEVLVARGSIKEPPQDLEPMVEEVVSNRLKQTSVAISDLRYVKDLIREQIKAGFQIVRQGYYRRWTLDLGFRTRFLKDRPLYVRVKFTTVEANKSTLEDPRTYPTLWQVGVPETPRIWRTQLSLASDSFQEFAIPPNLIGEDGRLCIDCINPNALDLLFLLDDGLELLYREAGFGVNFIRGMGIILCWLGLLTAIGLAAASFLSFPVAAFLALSILFVGLSHKTLSLVVEQGGVTGVNHDTGRIDAPGAFDRAVVALFAAALKTVNVVQDFSPIDYLSTGRSITWYQLGRAMLQIVFGLGGLFAAAGITLFTRRELATAQGSQ